MPNALPDASWPDPNPKPQNYQIVALTTDLPQPTGLSFIIQIKAQTRIHDRFHSHKQTSSHISNFSRGTKHNSTTKNIVLFVWQAIQGGMKLN